MSTGRLRPLLAAAATWALVGAITPALAQAAPQRAGASPDQVAGCHRFRDITGTSTHAFAVGYRGCQARGRIKEWDGDRWSNAAASIGRGAYLASISAVSDSDAWAVGIYSDHHAGTGMHPLTMHWDGVKWRNVRGPQPPEERGFNDVAMISSDDGWAVGDSQNVPHEGDYQTLIKHWDGQRWNVVLSPSPTDGSRLLQVSAVSADDVWAMGLGGTRSTTLLLHWNGDEWLEVPPPAGTITVREISAVSADDVWLVGSQDYYDSMTAHWDGTSWTIVPSPNLPGWRKSDLEDVSATGSDDVWAVGYGSEDYRPAVTFVEHWDGQAWSIVKSPDPGEVVNGLTSVSAASPTDAWAVGSFGDGISGSEMPLFMHWDGLHWSRTG